MYVLKVSRRREQGSRDGAVVRALASHQCGLGSTPGPGVICWLSLLLVFVLVPRGFSPATPVFPSPQKPTSPISIRSSVSLISSTLVHDYKIETIIKLFDLI